MISINLKVLVMYIVISEIYIQELLNRQCVLILSKL